uniref:Uncharacterized protein n=1 Tax=Arundo donax TaxID=35708 RepID=A0A0A9BPK7_ARUDO
MFARASRHFSACLTPASGHGFPHSMSSNHA